MLAGHADQMLNFSLLADVTGDGHDLRAQPFNLLAGTHQFMLVAGANYDIATPARKVLGQSEAESARATGDEHSLSMEIVRVIGAPLRPHPAGSNRHANASDACGQSHRGSSCG